MGAFKPNPNFRRELSVEVVDPAMERKADAVLRTAQVTCPVDTGALKKSLKKERSPRGWKISANTHYAVYVEFGTRRMRAYRFMGRALDAARDA